MMNRLKMSRRSFLYVATAAVGTTGIAVAAWPFLDQMNPDASQRENGDVVDVSLTSLQPAQPRRVSWHGVPIFVAMRTPAMLAAMQEASFVAHLIDPASEKRQQPTYAKNWHRSIERDYAVLVGVCTYCACILQYLEDTSPLGMAGGYICPCCASHFDPAGRAYSGIAQYNLPVPPYRIIGRSKIVIGKTMPGDLFSLDSIERI